MSRFRKVDPRIWNDAKFRELSNHGKLLFFMLLTHPGMTALGAMRATGAGLAEELGWEQEAFRKAFADVLSKGMAEHDPKACLVALPNFIRYNQPESPNVIKAWVGALDLLPECDLKASVLQRAKLIVGEMTEGFAKAMPNPEPEPKPKPIKKAPQTPKGAKPSGSVDLATWIESVKAAGEQPVPEDDPVFEYAESIGLPIDFLHLAWLEFRHQYTQPGAKRYIDWRAVFRKAVRGNWLKLWWLEGGETYALTTRGVQAQRAHQEKAA
jgi:hypothetical protein